MNFGWMEDVVLHYLPRSNARLNSQLEATEKLLKPFPCRPPPVFTPWFSDSHRPIRPAKSAPVISSFDPSYTPSASHSPGIASIVQKPLERLFSDRLQQDPKVFVSGTKENIVPPVLENTRAPSHKCKQGFSVKATPSLRCWSVFTHRGVLLKRSQPLSKGFCHVVSVLKLHLRQRVRWVISQHNCAGDIEQVNTDVRQGWVGLVGGRQLRMASGARGKAFVSIITFKTTCFTWITQQDKQTVGVNFGCFFLNCPVAQRKHGHVT